MKKTIKSAYNAEVATAITLFRSQRFKECFVHLERAHILGQRSYLPHLRSHWWMLKVGIKIRDWREILGQMLRLIASVGSLIGMVPMGNTGGANVSPIKPMPLPDDLAPYFVDDASPKTSTKRKFGFFSAALILTFAAISFYWLWSLQQSTEEIDRNWETETVEKLKNIGSTETLSILPLVNYHTANEALRGEAGVSYLIRTDQETILFDVGFNQNQTTPSPLEHNMQQLGIKLSDIDSIFLSHHHLDHAGGLGWVREQSFSLGTQQAPLGNTVVYAPVPLQYPGTVVTHIEAPTVIGTGLVSIGPIKRQLALGVIDEQALAIHVKGKGIVLVVGCGHQTLARIIERAHDLFDVPIYGIIGDLHYPVPEGRLSFAGINLQLRLASGTGPLAPITESDIERDFKLLRDENLGVLALGSHDTSDEVLSLAPETFGDIYKPVRVGEWISVAKVGKLAISPPTKHRED